MEQNIRNVVVLNPIVGTANQGTPGPCNTPWPVVLTEDGTDVCVKVADSPNKAVRVNIVAGSGVAQGALIDHSGTITLGGTSQLLAAANVNRRYLFMQNNSTADLWINFGVAAVISQPSIRLFAGDNFVMESMFISTQTVNIIGATTGQAFSTKEG